MPKVTITCAQYEDNCADYPTLPDSWQKLLDWLVDDSGVDSLRKLVEADDDFCRNAVTYDVRTRAIVVVVPNYDWFVEQDENYKSSIIQGVDPLKAALISLTKLLRRSRRLFVPGGVIPVTYRRLELTSAYPVRLPTKEALDPLTPLVSKSRIKTTATRTINMELEKAKARTKKVTKSAATRVAVKQGSRTARKVIAGTLPKEQSEKFMQFTSTPYGDAMFRALLALILPQLPIDPALAETISDELFVGGLADMGTDLLEKIGEPLAEAFKPVAIASVANTPKEDIPE